MVHLKRLTDCKADPSGRAVKGGGLQPLACCDCGFESRWGHVVCFQVDVCGTSRSLVQMSLTDCGVSECDREASIMRLWPTRDCSATEKGTVRLGLTPRRRNLTNNIRAGERSGKSTVVLRNFNLRRSQARKGGGICLNQSLTL